MPISTAEINRIRRIISDSITLLNLDLKGCRVLTEVGSNFFMFTPIIALMANADKVYAWTRDSRFGMGEEIIRECKELIAQFGLVGDIEFACNERPIHHIGSANLVTNLGFVRPLDSDFLEKLPGNCVVAGMCEAWELRPRDLDLEFCKKKGIEVAGTWENHPDLKIFDGCGHLAIKMAQEAGFEVYQNNIIVWSDDHFGDVISEAFKIFGARQVIKTNNVHELVRIIADIDFIFFCDYNEQRKIIGTGGFINIAGLQRINKGLGFIHLYGDIDFMSAKELGLRIYPEKIGQPSIMTFTLAHLGPGLIINLHTAGLKVGECLLKNEPSTLVQKI